MKPSNKYDFLRPPTVPSRFDPAAFNSHKPASLIKLSPETYDNTNSNLSTFNTSSTSMKIVRVVLSVLIVLITLGLIFIEFSFKDLLNIEYSICFSETLQSSPSYVYTAPLPPFYPDFFYSLGLNWWDTHELFTQTLILSKQYPQLMPANLHPSAVATLNTNILSEMDLFYQNQLLKTPRKQGECNHTIDPALILRQECANKTIFPIYLLIDASNKSSDNILSYGNHWALIIINKELREIVYFNSFSNHGPTQTIIEHLEQVSSIIGSAYPDPNDLEDDSPFKVRICIPEVSLQTDGVNCGPFVIFFLEEYLKNPNFDPSNIDRKIMRTTINSYRKKLTDNKAKNIATLTHEEQEVLQNLSKVEETTAYPRFVQSLQQQMLPSRKRVRSKKTVDPNEKNNFKSNPNNKKIL